MTKHKGLFVLAWFVVLFAFNVISHWSDNQDKNNTYIAAEALSRMTSPAQLLLSVAVIVGIIKRKPGEAPTDASVGANVEQAAVPQEVQTASVQTDSVAKPSSRKSKQGILLVAGIVSVLISVAVSVSLRQRSSNQRLKPSGLDNYALMQPASSDIGNEQDGLSPDTKKRMRETFFLQLAGALQKQSSPIRIDVAGDDHDILMFQLPSMNDETANELIQEFDGFDANFWNGARFMNYRQIAFSGDGYQKVVGRNEIIAHSKDYDKYKAAVLKAMQGFQAGAQGELTKP